MLGDTLWEIVLWQLLDFCKVCPRESFERGLVGGGGAEAKLKKLIIIN